MFCMKKRTLLTFLISGILFITACGAESGGEADSSDTGNIGESSAATSSIMEGSIKIEKNLPDRDIKIPDYLKGEDEEENDEENSVEESGEESVYHMSGEEQTEKARQVAAQIEDSINQVLRDKDYYPNVTGISVNPECTEFNVTFSGRNLSLYENVLPVSLCIVGDRFQLYQGKREDELMTIVNYIDGDSGEIFSTTNSGEIE